MIRPHEVAMNVQLRKNLSLCDVSRLCKKRANMICLKIKFWQNSDIKNKVQHGIHGSYTAWVLQNLRKHLFLFSQMALLKYFLRQ